ncbi:hypothetical protein GYMLUDRAFT_52679 [Collybiopsis luxurians FD-317 M1]|nr:hypothetical protein GYMLUDRAFT_52679 [Collybiopsis luxurians FD-317 M1]
MSDVPSKATNVEEIISGKEPSIKKVATEPVDEEGEESDDYDDFDNEDGQKYDEGEDGEDDEEEGAPPSKASLTALLLGNLHATHPTDLPHLLYSSVTPIHFCPRIHTLSLSSNSLQTTSNILDTSNIQQQNARNGSNGAADGDEDGEDDDEDDDDFQDRDGGAEEGDDDPYEDEEDATADADEGDDAVPVSATSNGAKKRSINDLDNTSEEVQAKKVKA